MVVEGLTDFLTWAGVMGVPTIGVYEGAAGAFRTTKLHPDVQLAIGTHVDVKGVKYAREVADAMPMRLIREVPLERLGRVA